MAQQIFNGNRRPSTAGLCAEKLRGISLNSMTACTHVCLQKHKAGNSQSQDMSRQVYIAQQSPLPIILLSSS